jgi:GrpB-like predicted nucleotidyltransferase (UPF0157 family)
MLTARDIVTFVDDQQPAEASPWIDGHGPSREVRVIPFNPAWPGRYANLANTIRSALGDRVLGLEHIGSTSVRGLAAKPVIDIDLAVADARDEASYVPALERSGFVHVLREPSWYQHRLLRHEQPACNLHVFSPECAEAERHRIFRDWLRAHPEDRMLYAEAKMAASAQTTAAGGHQMDYNARKQTVVREIYTRAFRELGLYAQAGLGQYPDVRCDC